MKSGDYDLSLKHQNMVKSGVSLSLEVLFSTTGFLIALVTITQVSKILEIADFMYWLILAFVCLLYSIWIHHLWRSRVLVKSDSDGVSIRCRRFHFNELGYNHDEFVDVEPERFEVWIGPIQNMAFLGKVHHRKRFIGDVLVLRNIDTGVIHYFRDYASVEKRYGFREILVANGFAVRTAQ